MLPENLRSQLLRAAREALQKAYAPYSQIRVGAALLTRTGNIFAAGNVENASYGLSVCAERAAIAAAVAGEGPPMRIRALAVLNEAGSPFTPCGACRQVIHEFGADADVLFQGKDGLNEMRADELLPRAFALQKMPPGS